jgi:putative peptidoglycan lipid II flippase
MGPAMPYAVAAKFAYPDRPVFALVGDGAMQMNGNNVLVTVKKYWKEWKDPRFCILVLNNRDLNMVTWELRAQSGEPKFEGAVSWLNYAFRLMYLPLGIFGVSIATAAMPGIARHAARDDVPGMRHEVASGIAMMTVLNVPATLGLMVLARPIVAMLFQRGAFTARDTDATAAALMCYAIGLTGYSVVKVVSPTFYALHESRKPVMVSAVSVLINAALNIMFVKRFGYLGLAVGTSVTALLNASVLLGMLRSRLGGIEGARLTGVFTRSLAASLVMAATAFALDAFLGRVLPGRALALQGIRVGSTIAAAIGMLLAAAWMLRLHEINDVLRALGSRVTRPRRG